MLRLESLRPGDGRLTRDIALGRDPYVKLLARQTGAAYWREWAARALTKRTVTQHFGRAFHQAAERATIIHFALDDIEAIAAAVRAGRRGFTPGNFTNAELRYIVTHSVLLQKTQFYRGGEPVPTLAFPFLY